MLTTTQRGLGGDHQTQRRLALTSLQDGDLCARCQTHGIEHPMWRSLVTWRDGKPTSKWLDLDDFPPRIIARALGITPVKRLSYRTCNRSHGAKIGNPRRAGKPRIKARTYSRW